MEKYKEEFINFLLEKESLKIGKFKLKSGRISPYFINIGMFDDGEGISKLGYFYAAKIMERFKPGDFEIIFGPAYKGILLALSTIIALNKDFNINKGYLFNRKEPKDHSEATKENRQESLIIGHKVEDGSKILIIDDVITSGGTIYESVNLLNSIADNLQYAGLIIAINRQEVGLEGEDAIKEFKEKTKIPVDSIVNISEIIEYLWRIKKITESEKQRLEEYLKHYGTKEVKKKLI